MEGWLVDANVARGLESLSPGLDGHTVGTERYGERIRALRLRPDRPSRDGDQAYCCEAAASRKTARWTCGRVGLVGASGERGGDDEAAP